MHTSYESHRGAACNPRVFRQGNVSPVYFERTVSSLRYKSGYWKRIKLNVILKQTKYVVKFISEPDHYFPARSFLYNT